MAAATTSDTKVLAAFKEKLLGCVRNLVDDANFNDATERCFADNFTIPQTSLDDVGDIRRLLQFPGGAYLTDLRITAGDMDTGALLSFDVVVTDANDVVKDTLIAATTVGRAGGSARIQDSAVGQFVGDRYLAIKVVAATTPASPAAVLGVFGKLCVGIMSYQSGGPYPIMTDVNV